MRQVLVQVPRGRGDEVLRLAERHGGTNVARLEGHDGGGPVDLVVAHVANARLGRLLDDLQELPALRVTFAPQGVLALHPPADQAAEQVRDVAPRSPIEVYLSGLQSVGSWKAFLGYAALSAVVVWIGLVTNTIYLLTAAMLIAPFASPAMNVALATARGDHALLGRGLLRYVAALAVAVAATAALTLLFGQRVATTTVVELSLLSNVAVLLPLAAGAAGALNLCQSERSSLVSGAATGMLVAASLAPPAGIVGMGLVLGRGDLVGNALFVLALQILGINLSGALVFRAFGLTSRGPRFARGRRATVVASSALTLVALGALVGGQLWTRPALQRASRSQDAAAVVNDAVAGSGVARLVEADVRFTRPAIPGQNTLLAVVYVQRSPGAEGSDAQLRERLARAIAERLRGEGFHVAPAVTVTVLSP